MKKLIVSIAILLTSFTAIFAQIGGSSTYNILEMNMSPFSTALGGKIISNTQAKELIFFNPALLNNNNANNLSLCYKSYLADIKMGSFSFSFNQTKLGNIAFGIHYINYGQFEHYDAFANYYGQFTASDYVPFLTYSFQPDSQLSIGINIKAVYSHLETYSSYGYSIDLGLYFKVNSQLSWALVARNIGRQIKPYFNNIEPLPFNLSFGLTAKPKYTPFRFNITMEYLNKWNIRINSPLDSLYRTTFADTISFVYKTGLIADEIMRHTCIGTQIILSPKVHLLLGYNYRHAKELALPTRRSLAGVSMGIIISTPKITFSYSMEKISLLNAHTFAITLNLNKLFFKQKK